MNLNDIQHNDHIPDYVALAKAIAPNGIAYLHVMRTVIGAETALREAFPGKLVKRFERDASLNAPDQATFYTPGPKGYTDYPVFA